MKTFIVIGLWLLTSQASMAQTVVVNNDLNKFIGNWRWTNGADTVEIVLEKQVYNIPFVNSNRETLVGWHRYVKNGILEQSSFQYIGRNVNIDFNSNDLDFKTTLLGGTYPNNPSKVFFTSFWDLTLHKNFNLFFTMVAGSTTQAKWLLKQPRGLYVGPPGLNGVFTLPKNLILTKY